MKKLLGFTLLTLISSPFTQAAQTLNCRADALNRNREITYFKIQEGLNFSAPELNISGRAYNLEITLTKNYLKIWVKKKGHLLHYSKVRANATTFEAFDFAFMDGSRHVGVLCE